jgi:hypothetical protein
MEEGADEKLQREVEEELRLAELERLMLQEEQVSGDIQVIFTSACDRLNFQFCLHQDVVDFLIAP